LSQVKKNCPKLWSEAALHTSTTAPLSVKEYSDLGHGRQVQRRVEVYGAFATPLMGWNAIERIIKVQRWGCREGRPFNEIAYYVLSKPIDCAEIVAAAIQSHWSIENRLHWAKDVNFREDYTTIRKHGQVSILLQLNNIAFNALTLNGYKVVKNTFAKFANKVKELSCLFFFETKD